MRVVSPGAGLSRRAMLLVAAAGTSSMLRQPAFAAPKLDRQAQKVLDSGIALAAEGADPETQIVSAATLRKAEERFTLLVEELAPECIDGYTNRANVRVALKDYTGALSDYDAALGLDLSDAQRWVTLLNRGSTLTAVGRNEEALKDLDISVALSKRDQYALLGRANTLHAMGRWAEATVDHAAAVANSANDVQPFWLRYALELYELGERADAIGFCRRVKAKFDLEPEVTAALAAMLWCVHAPPPATSESPGLNVTCAARALLLAGSMARRVIATRRRSCGGSRHPTCAPPRSSCSMTRLSSRRSASGRPKRSPLRESGGASSRTTDRRNLLRLTVTRRYSLRFSAPGLR